MQGPLALPAACRSGQLWKALLPRTDLPCPGKALQVKSPARALVAGEAPLISEAVYLGLPRACGQNVLGNPLTLQEDCLSPPGHLLVK